MPHHLRRPLTPSPRPTPPPPAPHAQERFYFGDQVLPLFESGIPLLRERLRQLPDADNITIAYPDEGAWKRFHYQFGDYPEVRAAALPVCVGGGAHRGRGLGSTRAPRA